MSAQGLLSAHQVAAALAGKPVKSYGGNYLVRCPAHDDASLSLSIRDGDRGLIVHCFVGCTPRDVYAAIRHKGLKLDPNNTAREPTKGTSEYERQQHDKAAWLWSLHKPITNTPAQRYLRARGITCPLPATLGFLSARGEHPPALISAFTIPDEPEPGIVGTPRLVQSVHLTKLKPDGSGKADVQPNKIIIGSPGSLPIVLAPPNDLLGLCISEGVEDGLTAHKATGLGAWAAGSAGRMPKLASVIPSYIECVTILAHDDQAGQDGARRLAEALYQRRIEVIIEGMS
jgi:Toprim domain